MSKTNETSVGGPASGNRTLRSWASISRYLGYAKSWARVFCMRNPDSDLARLIRVDTETGSPVVTTDELDAHRREHEVPYSEYTKRPRAGV